MSRDSEMSQVFARWWHEFIDTEDSRKKADRAALRRLGTAKDISPPEIDVTGAIMIHAFRVLHGRLSKWREGDWETRLVVAASVLAHVRSDKPNKTTAALLGAGEDSPLMAESRFRRLLRTTDPVELSDQVRRAVALLGRNAPVGDLGASLFAWDARTRRAWATAYWRLDAVADAPVEALSTEPISAVGAA